MPFNVCSSAISSASNTSMSGQTARALASGSPTARPRRAATSSSAVTTSALFCLATTIWGNFPFVFAELDCESHVSSSPPKRNNSRRIRSVGSRGSHRLRMRLRTMERDVTEEALITLPLHDPLAGLAMTVTDKPRFEHGGAPRLPCRAWRRARRAHDPPCLRGRRQRACRHPQQQPGNAGGPRRVVVTLDATAAQSVFGKITPINKSRGRLITWPTDARRW